MSIEVSDADVHRQIDNWVQKLTVDIEHHIECQAEGLSIVKNKIACLVLIGGM